jgi:hypothetical protein
MSGNRRQEVIETALETAAEQVRAHLREHEAGDLLKRLPEGEQHKLRRPDGAPSSWPDLRPARPAAGERAA